MSRRDSLNVGSLGFACVIFRFAIFDVNFRLMSEAFEFHSGRVETGWPWPMCHQLSPPAGSLTPRERRALAVLGDWASSCPSLSSRRSALSHIRFRPEWTEFGLAIPTTCTLHVVKAQCAPPLGYPYIKVEINFYIRISRISALAPFVS